MSIPDLSVLIPTYNRHQYLSFALDSILKAQTTLPAKVIIYDDGSTDKTPELIKLYQTKYKQIVYLRETTNKGVGFARDTLIQNCNTRYAMWQDSDDYSHPRRIEVMYKYCFNKTLMYFSGYTTLKDNNPVGSKHIGRGDPVKLGFATCMFDVDKEARFNHAIKFGGEDWDWIRGMLCKHPISMTGSVLYFIRYHSRRIGHIKKHLTSEQKKTLSYAEADRIIR